MKDLKKKLINPLTRPIKEFISILSKKELTDYIFYNHSLLFSKPSGEFHQILNKCTANKLIYFVFSKDKKPIKAKSINPIQSIPVPALVNMDQSMNCLWALK